MLVHLDTDIGGDPDDVCALAMLLGWDAVELAAITTVHDPQGVRAGLVHHCLDLAGGKAGSAGHARRVIPVASGAGAAIATLDTPGHIPIDDVRYWPPVKAAASRPGVALDLLARSIEAGATVVAVGPFTNLALLEIAQPGILADAPLVVMGGWVDPARPGVGGRGPDGDWNVQCDVRAAEIVFTRARHLTCVSLAVTLEVHLKESQVPRLRAAGPLGDLIANQGIAHRVDYRLADAARTHPRLPADILNFQHDPLACAVACGWAGVTVERTSLAPVVDDGALRLVRDPSGVPVDLVTDVDAARFDRDWLAAVERAAGQSIPSP